MIIDSPIISGSYLSTGSLSQTGNVSITGSLTATAGITGSFSGSGADLFGIPAAGITGLNLSQISSGSVSASISPSQGLLINTSVSASNFTGSFTGSLTGIATSASYASFALTSSYSLGGSGFPFSGSAVITGSLLVSGSAQITGSLSVSGSISASLFGTASQATSASYALTASYLLGYISPFPFTGSAAITGSLIVTGSVAISTLTTGSGVRYVIADQNGLLSAQTASAAIFTTQQVVSTSNQTTFPITNGYSTGYVTVFVNGTKLSADEYVDTSGTNIIFLTGSALNDVVEFQKYLPASGVSNNTLRTVNYFTTTLGQTVFTVNYTPGLLDVFYNGSKLNSTEYTAANGTSITLATGSNLNDSLEVDVYSYQVGAFSGIGGVGVAKELAFYNTTNSITGSNKVTYDGSTFSITGSFLVTGSSTFTNIGPAVFSGSVTAVGGFSGSFSGNADSASLAQNSLLLQGTGSIGFATTASLLAVSSSQQQISASLLTLTASYTALSSSYTALSGSYNTYSSSVSTRTTQIEQVYATTGSNSFRADQSITGSLVVSSTITAQTLVVQTVTSSIVYSSGSNIFGNQLANTQTFTGSVNITGSSHAIFGNVGIGTLTPSAISTYTTLDIRGTTGGAIRLGIAGNSNPFNLQHDGTDAYFNNVNSGSIHFYTNNTPKMMISGSGYVGIGTTSPGMPLELYVADGSGLRLKNAGSADKKWDLAVSGNDLRINETGVSATISFKAGGNVGIGITSPTTQFNVYTSSAATSNVMVEFYNGDYTATTRNFIRVRNGISVGTTYSSYFGQGADHNTYIIANDTSRNDITINGDNGKVGIGTNSTTDQLTVAGSGAILRLKSSLSYTDMAFQNSVVTNFIESEEGRFHFFVGGGSAGNRQLTVSSSGMVGIGTAVPAYNLDVVGSGRFTGNVYASGVPLQVVAGNADVTSGAEGTGQSLVSNASGITPAWNDGLQVASISFTPKKSNSIILIQTNNIVMWERSNVSDQFYLWASNYTDGIVLVKSGQRLMNFGPGYQNGGIISLCGYFSSWGTSAKTISFRIGTTGGAAGAYFEWNPYYGASGFSSATVGNFTYVITEIGQ